VTGRQPLALRLAALLAAAVVIVLLLAGILVNRAVSRSLEQTLTNREEQRLAVTVAVLQEALERDVPATERGMRQLMGRIAQTTGGRAVLTDSSGQVVAEAGRLPPGSDRQTLREPVSTSGGDYVLEISLPGGGQPFLQAFNAALLLAGGLSVLAIVVIGSVAANRLTRPLRGVAAAAHRLGGGDLTTRAAGGGDRESSELADAFNGMAERLERSEMLRRRAASDMAHDLATPATLLESQLQAMIDGVVPADRDQLERARLAAGSLSGVIRQLGELAGAEAAPLHRRAERFELATLVADVTQALQGLFRERDVTVRTTRPDGELPVVADRGHVERAIRNVITNAAQHSPAGAEVLVALDAAPGATTVRVIDHGVGIPTENLPHVFERFYRADRSRSAAGPPPGSGIGLTIARELLAANGGSIEVERTGPDGTTFLIRLPAG